MQLQSFILYHKTFTYIFTQSPQIIDFLVAQLYWLQFEDEESEKEQGEIFVTDLLNSRAKTINWPICSTRCYFAYFHSFLGKPNYLSLFSHNCALYVVKGIKLLYNSPNFSVYCVFLSYPHTIYYFSVIDFMIDLIFSTGSRLPLRNVTCQVYQFLQ